MTSLHASTNKLEQAWVEWWNDSSVFVRCPFCDTIHRHGFCGQYRSDDRRVSHCNGTNRQFDYLIRFPFDPTSGDVGYEIDKERALFVAGRASPAVHAHYQEREGSHLGPSMDDFRGRRRWNESTEEIHISEADCGLAGGYTIPIIERMETALVTGKVAEVRHYLETSNDAGVFLHGIESHEPLPVEESASSGDGEDSPTHYSSEIDELQQTVGSGKTALHFAACEASSDMVLLLLQHGADPNAVDVHGRTPLMEAALWGRRQSVEYLLDHGADRRLECFYDGRRLRAVDFASPHPKNTEERHRFVLDNENTHRADLDRREIVRI